MKIEAITVSFPENSTLEKCLTEATILCLRKGVDIIFSYEDSQFKITKDNVLSPTLKEYQELIKTSK